MRNSLVIQRVAVDTLRPSVLTLLHHPRKQLEKTKGFLNAFGQIPPVIAAADGEILCWEEIWLALKERGDALVDVIFLNDKSPEELAAIRIALQRIPQDSKWDQANVRSVLENLISVDFDVTLTGLDAHEIDTSLNLDIPDKNVEETGADIPRVQTTAVSAQGVIWQLHKHRVGCGNATDAGFVRRVLNAQLVDLCLTDPPYNVAVDGFISGKGRHRHREFIQGAGELSDEQFFSFLQEFLSTAKANCKPSALVMTFIDWRHICEMIAAGRHSDMQLHQVITWVKSNGGMGGIWRNQSEFLCVFEAGDTPPLNNVELGKNGRNRTNVWFYPGFSSFGRDRDDLLGLHPTVKPVAMLADALRDVTRRGNLILDTFLGSGSTLIAAEETGRICCGVELDPLYVDVAVRRWQTKTGRSAICSETGETFDDRAQRLIAAPAQVCRGQ